MGFYYEESNSSNFVTKPIEGFYYDREDDLFKDENGFYYGKWSQINNIDFKFVESYFLNFEFFNNY